MFLYFPAFLLVVSFESLAEVRVTSYCVATIAKEGEKARISCHFDTDINTLERDVLVHVFKANKFQQVLNIAWYDGQPIITTEPGYECNGRISNDIIIEIPKANPDHAGEYKCSVVPNVKEDAQKCTLTIAGVRNDSLLTTFRNFPTTKLAEDRDTSLVPKSSSTISADTKTSCSDHITTISFGVALLVLIILGAVVVLIGVKKRWIRFSCTSDHLHENPTNLNLL